MFNYIISAAHAAEGAAGDAVAAVAPAATVSSELMRFMPLFLIFMVFYFLLIRPQQKKYDEQAKMLAALKKGDKVLLGGLMGTLVKIESDSIVVVELAKGVEVKALRSAITGLEPKPQLNDNKK